MTSQAQVRYNKRFTSAAVRNLGMRVLAMATQELIDELYRIAETIPLMDFKAVGCAAGDREFIATNEAVRPSQSHDSHPADLKVVREGRAWRVRALSNWIPLIDKQVLRQGYRDLVQQCKDDAETLWLVRGWKRQAWDWAKAVDSRFETLVRVAEALLVLQPNVLEHGWNARRPLNRQDVARHLGHHPSTISRAIKDKWIHTPLGTVPLSAFLHQGIGTSVGTRVPRQTLETKMRRYFAQEDATRPLSDRELIVRLADEGIALSRWSVRKLRQTMGVGNSRERRQLAP